MGISVIAGNRRTDSMLGICDCSIKLRTKQRENVLIDDFGILSGCDGAWRRPRAMEWELQIVSTRCELCSLPDSVGFGLSCTVI